jgi:type VI protein secretion system component VasK
MGTTGEADRRGLEGLFTKQRAYFIKDLVRERIFTEQGLVRPTRKRIVRARRNALAAYGLAAGCAFLSLLGPRSWSRRSPRPRRRKR